MSTRLLRVAKSRSIESVPTHTARVPLGRTQLSELAEVDGQGVKRVTAAADYALSSAVAAACIDNPCRLSYWRGTCRRRRAFGQPHELCLPLGDVPMRSRSDRTPPSPWVSPRFRFLAPPNPSPISTSSQTDRITTRNAHYLAEARAADLCSCIDKWPTTAELLC